MPNLAEPRNKVLGGQFPETIFKQRAAQRASAPRSVALTSARLLTTHGSTWARTRPLFPLVAKPRRRFRFLKNRDLGKHLRESKQTGGCCGKEIGGSAGGSEWL